MKAPDLHAPRYRQCISPVITPKFMRVFRKKYPQYAQYTQTQLFKLIKKINKEMVNEILTSREGVELPAGLGYLFIGTVPCKKKKNIAWKQSIELGVKVYHRNWETDNKVARIFYNNYGVNYKFEGRNLWYFTAIRSLKRQMAVEYPKNYQKYMQVASHKTVWEMFNKSQFKDKIQAKNKEQLKYYNEFE